MKRERKSAHIGNFNSGKGQKREDTRTLNQKNNPIPQKIKARKKIFSIFIIALITFISYFPTFDNEITSWDDEFYINTNPYLKDLTFKTISELFKTETYYMGNYHPLSMISLSIDYALGGEDDTGNIKPFMFHFTNVILHIFVSIFVFLMVLSLFKNFNIAFVVGILFGVHTIHVESVAWISERKDVLYAFFFILSLIAYLKYTDFKKLRWYFISLLLFLFSLLSKGQAVSLAVTLIFIDYLRNRKLLDKKVIIEKLPFFILSLIFGYLAIQAQKQSEALVEEQAYTIIQRTGIAAFAFVQYLAKLLLPVNLSAIYPYTDIIGHTIPAYYYLMIIPVMFIVFFFFYFIKKSKKEIVFAIAFFIVNILLLLQFIPVGSAVFADRYAYIPSVGFFIIIALILNHLYQYKTFRLPIFLIAGFYVGFILFLTVQRIEVWQNSETLWTDTVKKSPGAVTAWNNLGSFKDKEAAEAMKENRYVEAKQLRLGAIQDFTKAINGKPDYKNAFFNRGVSRFELGKLISDTILIKSSVNDFNKSLEQDAQFSEAYFNRANAKSELGLIEAALKDFNIAIGLNPDKSDYYANRGVAYGKSGHIDAALNDFNKSLILNPKESGVYSNRGRAKMLKGEELEALIDFNKAIAINPLNYQAYFNRAITKQKLKDYKGAMADFEKTIDLKTDMAEAYYQRGLLFLEINQKENACKDFMQANKFGSAYAAIMITQFCKN